MAQPDAKDMQLDVPPVGSIVLARYPMATHGREGIEAPAVVVGVQRLAGTLSVSFGFEPVIDDVTVPVGDVQLLRRALTNPLALERLRALAAQALVRQAPPLTSPTQLDAQQQRHDAVEQELRYCREWVAATKAALRLAAPSSEAARFMYVPQACCGVRGLAVLRAAVLLAIEADTTARVMVVVSDMASLAGLRRTFDAQVAGVDCTLCTYGGSAKVEDGVAQLWCAAADDIVAAVSDAGAGAAADEPWSCTPEDFDRKALVVLAGDEKYTTTLSVAELENAWGVGRTTEAPTLESSEAQDGCVRVSVPLSLAQLEALAHFARDQWFLRERGFSPEALLCSTREGTDARLVAFRDIVEHVRLVTATSPTGVAVAGRSPASPVAPSPMPRTPAGAETTTTAVALGFKIVVLCPEDFHDARTLGLAAGLPAVVVRAAGKVDDREAGLRTFSRATHAALVVYMRRDDALDASLAVRLADSVAAVIAMSEGLEEEAMRWSTVLPPTASIYCVSYQLEGPVTQLCGDKDAKASALLALTVSQVFDPSGKDSEGGDLYERYAAQDERRKKHRTEAGASSPDSGAAATCAVVRALQQRFAPFAIAATPLSTLVAE